MVKILIVDDDDGILDALSLILEEEGYEVDTLVKGLEVLTKVKKTQPDLILLDMLLSGNDGRHICKSLKADTKTKKIPILMISAHPNAKISAFESGADDFLPKPFEREELLKKIAYVVSERK